MTCLLTLYCCTPFVTVVTKYVSIHTGRVHLYYSSFPECSWLLLLVHFSNELQNECPNELQNECPDLKTNPGWYFYCSYTLTPLKLATTDLFFIYMVLCFPQCLINGITRGGTFETGFFHSFECLCDSSKLLCLVVFHCVGILPLTYPFTE